MNEVKVCKSGQFESDIIIICSHYWYYHYYINIIIIIIIPNWLLTDNWQGGDMSPWWEVDRQWTDRTGTTNIYWKVQPGRSQSSFITSSWCNTNPSLHDWRLIFWQGYSNIINFSDLNQSTTLSWWGKLRISPTIQIHVMSAIKNLLKLSESVVSPVNPCVKLFKKIKKTGASKLTPT